MTGKRVLAGVLAAALLAVSPGFTAFAEEGQETPAADGAEAPQPEKTPEELAAEEEARKNAIYETIPDSNQLPGWPEGPKVHAASAIVMDMESGAVLYAKAAEEQHFPASITKLLTTLVALETGEPDDTVTFTEDSISFLEPGDASIGMLAGEQLSLNDALHAVLLASANEVSYAVAENMGIKMGGTYQTFIDRMNERSAELGCTGSHWVNANGLHDDQHYTTAHDMARIASAVYQYEPFHHFMGALEYTIAPTSLKNEARTCWQNHRMLWPENEFYYEFCRGGKTGYTDQSGTTLVTMADNGQMRLAAVVMADYGIQAYEDTRAMLDYAFGNFTKVTIADKETSGDIETFQDEGAYVVLPAGVDFTQLECQISAAEAPAGTGAVSFDRWIEVLTAPPAPPAETPADGADGTQPGAEGTPEAPADGADGAQPGADGTPEAQTDGSQPGADGTPEAQADGADGTQPGEEGTPEAQAGTTPVSADGTQPEADETAGEGSSGSDGDSGTFGNAAGEDDALFGSERAGTIVYTYAGQEAGHAAVVLNQSYFGQESEMEWTPADGSKRKSGESSPAKLGRFSTRQMIVAGGAAVLLIVVLCIGLNRRKRAQERKRRNRKNDRINA
nr:serine hydrolase [uncultured Schaedlerella sp.]